MHIKLCILYKFFEHNIFISITELMPARAYQLVSLIAHLKKKIGTLRHVVVARVRNRPTLVLCLAVLGFSAPSSLDTLRACSEVQPHMSTLSPQDLQDDVRNLNRSAPQDLLWSPLKLSVKVVLLLVV